MLEGSVYGDTKLLYSSFLLMGNGYGARTRHVFTVYLTEDREIRDDVDIIFTTGDQLLVHVFILSDYI
jgi:hypothetical protein